MTRDATLDVAHPCWTGVEDDFDHDWEIETFDQGDGIWYECSHARVCQACGEVDEEWDGGDDSFEDTYAGDSYAR